MAKKKKYYVVWEGVEPGIYEDWNSAKLQIHGFPGARYKSFTSREEAEFAYNDEYGYKTSPKKPVSQKERNIASEIITPSISVDAACSGNPGRMEYQGVWTSTGDPIFYQGPFQQGTNNVGEFLAIVHGLAIIKKNEWPSYTIYSDSKIAMGWVAKKKCNTQLQESQKNKDLFTLIRRAEEWLKKNDYSSPVVKWQTKSWGEIPADFGRK